MTAVRCIDIDGKSQNNTHEFCDRIILSDFIFKYNLLNITLGMCVENIVVAIKKTPLFLDKLLIIQK